VVTVLLFGDADAQANVTSGNKAQVAVGMVTPAKPPSPVKAHVALRATCEGYGVATTTAKEIALAVVDPPTVDFGTIVVPAKAP
jgi:hypothetical protein